MWYVYLLHNKLSNRTYIGCTTDYKRRLRQHNREIAGGAKSTNIGKGSWVLRRVLTGFENRSIAMRWEKILKLRSKGLINRTFAFHELAHGRCPTKGKQYEVPKEIKLELL